MAFEIVFSSEMSRGLDTETAFIMSQQADWLVWSMERNTVEVKDYRQLFGYQNSAKYHVLFNRERKLVQVWNWMWINADIILIFETN